METEQKQKKILFAGLTILVLAGIFLYSTSLLDRNTPVIQTAEPVASMLSDGPGPCEEHYEEFGDPTAVDTQTIVYTTRCTITDSTAAYGGDYVSRTYIRGAGNEYNKLLLETKEQIMWTSIIPVESNIIHIQTSDSYGHNEKKYFFNKKGEPVEFDPETERKNYKRILNSPDGRYSASLPLPEENEYRAPAIVEVLDQETGKTESYDFTKQVHELNGVYVDSWSPDSGYLYVAGGIYEFEAPAKLWRIDVQRGSIKKYGLDKFSFPVRVYADRGMAFVTKGGCGDRGGYTISSGSVDEIPMESKATCPTELHLVNLETGAVSLISKESSIYSYGNMFLWKDKIYHNASYGFAAIDADSYRSSSVIEKINLATKKSSVYSDDESRIELFIPEKEKAIMQMREGYYLVSLATDARDYIGKPHIASQGANLTREEQVTNIIGLAK